MSYSQYLGHQGAAMPPNITEDILLDVINSYGTTFDLYIRGQTIDCICINSVYGSADRECPLCGGTGSTGGYAKQPDRSFLGILQFRSEGRQDQHQKLYSKHGPIDTMDGRLYTQRKYFEIIHIDDVLVWKPPTSEDGYELKIISKDPEFVLRNQQVFVTCDVTRNPYPMRSDASDLRKHL